MEQFMATEECPGCGIVFKASPEMAKVDFTGIDFEPAGSEE